MTSLAWKLNRLRTMGAAEIVWRVGQQLRRRAAGFGIGLVREVPAPDESHFGMPWLVADATTIEPIDRGVLGAAAGRIAAGCWSVFSLDDAPLGFPPEWNRDPRTGIRAPMTLGLAIDHRDERIVGDIKYLWEPARHLELVTLAAAAAAGDTRRGLDARALLESWFEQCPYPDGVHWSSSLELAVRLVHWSAAWHLHGGAGVLAAGLKQRWLDSVYRHCRFVAGHLSRHSSANNHLFGEWLGLYVAATTWPCWPESASWRAAARAGLLQEALLQNAPDGVNREQAVCYQHEVIAMMLIAERVAHAQGESFGKAFLDRLERLADYVAALMDAGGNVPMWGDADDARWLRFADAPQADPYRPLLAACALMFDRADFKAKAGPALDTRNRWLFGAAGIERWNALESRHAPPRRAFPDGGMFVLGSDFDTPQEVRIVVDCAPLGYLSIAAHGHADALAFTLSAGGLELLVDPGTYAYHTQQRWRDHFRGTLAHNTVRIDGSDQSVIGGNFMWLQHANAQLRSFDADAAPQVFEGEHDGYRRLSDPVTHRRRLVWEPVTRTLTVTDTVECRYAHDVEIAWHFDERCAVRAENATLRATRGMRGLCLVCDDSTLVPDLCAGRDDPPAGWVSRRFDRKEPATCAVFSVRIEGSRTIRTRITVD